MRMMRLARTILHPPCALEAVASAGLQSRFNHARPSYVDYNSGYKEHREYNAQNRSRGHPFGSTRQGAYGAGFRRPARRSSDQGPLAEVEWGQCDLPKIQENIYKEHPDVAARSQDDLKAWMSKHNVNVNGSNIPSPVLSFEEANFPATIFKHLQEFKAPTPIQSISWPIALGGRDLISVAQTGSGKTLAFMLPAIQRLASSPRTNGTSVVVLVPTRELAQQVSQVSSPFLQSINRRLVCLYGGADRFAQERELRKGADVVVATPGRLIDMLGTSSVDIKNCNYLVLDEADRMLDFGFEPQIRNIVSQIRPDRQTLMFSATWPNDVRKLASAFQKNAVFLNVGSLELSANPDIKQHVKVVNDRFKDKELLNLLEELNQKGLKKTIIFVAQKRDAERLRALLMRVTSKAMAIHGDKTQNQRDYCLQQFRAGHIPLLIATDVAARGIDISDIENVINYDYPNNTEFYVHRIGRTGRAGKTGNAYTFLTSDDADKVPELIGILKKAGQEVPEELLQLQNYKKKGNSNWKNQFGTIKKYRQY
ncbi:unnamed protein product, partial [Mesorhabditis spiculigera]